MDIETGELINILSHTPPTRRPLRLAVAIALVMCVSALLTIAVLGLRPELNAVQPPHSFWLKTFLLSALLAISSRALVTASTPVTVRQNLWPAFVLGTLVFVCVISEWATTDDQTIIGYFFLPNFPACLAAVTLYGGLGMAGLTLLMRHYAPANIPRCAQLIGLTAAAAGAVGYSIHCPLDSPTFIVVAYGLPIAGLALLARRISPRFLHW